MGLRSESGADGGNSLVLVGELASPEKPREETAARLAHDDGVSHHDVELAEGARRDGDLDSELPLQLRGETRRLGLVVSSGAVEDLDIGHFAIVARRITGQARTPEARVASPGNRG